jgi:hypothetical protein
VFEVVVSRCDIGRSLDALDLGRDTLIKVSSGADIERIARCDYAREVANAAANVGRVLIAPLAKTELLAEVPAVIG